MSVARIALLFVSLLQILGCASGPSDQPRYPRDATVYKCDACKELVVRYIDSGRSAVIVYPEREFRLDRAPAASGVRYTNGQTSLETKDEGAILEEGGRPLFAECVKAGR